MTRRASCSCGQLSVEVDGEPLRVSVCHCLDCKRRTGSAFGAQARWPRSQSRIAGTSTAWLRATDKGNTIAFHFCPTCGATVHYTVSTAPDVIAIAMGAFADPTFPAPTVSVYELRMHPWATIGGDVEHLD
jgi:hypothetical protein